MIPMLFKFNQSLFLLIILLGVSTHSQAQNTWQYAGDYDDIAGLYDSQHFVVDDGNRDYKFTTDGGTTLQNLGMSISSPQSLAFVEYLSAIRLRAVVFTGNNFELHESTDGGSTFTKLSDILPAGMPPLNQPPQMVSFDNSESLLTCKVLHNSQLIPVLFRTIDGGNSWNLATADTTTFSNLHDIEIYKDGHVVVALPSGIEVSVDRGITFNSIGSNPPLNNGMHIAYDGGQNIWVSSIVGSQNADSYISADGGNSWNPWSAAPDDVDMKFAKPASLLIHGLSDTTALSTDGGTTFSTVKFPATKPVSYSLRLRLGGDQQTYYVNDGSAKLWTLGTGSGIGLTSWSADGKINIYPNPASNQLYFEDYEGVVEIYSAAGQVLKSTVVCRGKSLDISAMPAGLLIVKLAQGNSLILKK